jgi:hypothetical protein
MITRTRHIRMGRGTGATLSAITAAPEAISPRNKESLDNAARSRLSFIRLSFALLIIGVFWMLVQLHEYVVWLRGGEKALLLAAIALSCISIYMNDREFRSLLSKKNKFGKTYSICVLCLTISLVIYLTISEPSPVSLQFPEILGAERLRLEVIAIILLVLAPFGCALAGIRIEKISRYLPLYIMVFSAFCMLGRVISFVYYTCGADFPHTLLKCHGAGVIDIAATTLNAVHAVQKGINPYTADIQGINPSAYRGYRYWPMMFAAYMPLASFFTTGWGAVRVINFVLDVITTALVIVLARRRSGWLCGLLAASLYLMLPMLADQIYAAAATDIVPTVLVLAALAMYPSRPGLAGTAVGLSVSAKLLPGLLMLVCCVPQVQRSRYIGGFVLGLIPAIAFCLLAPADFIYNTVWVLAGTPVDLSSWQYGAPSYMIRATQFALILFMAAVAFMMIWRPPDWFGRCAVYVICVVATLLASHPHNNYMLWWIPFFCILLSSPLSRILSLPEKTDTLSCVEDERTQPGSNSHQAVGVLESGVQ